MRNRRLFLLVIPFTLALALLIVGAFLWYGSRAPHLEAHFSLNHRGENWSFDENAKKLNLVYVGYVKCPDVCPMSLSYAAQAFHKISKDQLKNTQLIFISVDTAHDTPASVADYAVQFYPSFVGLTGSQIKVDEAVRSMGASYMVEKDPKSYLGYSIAHSDRIFFLDKKGIVIDSLANPRSEESVTKKIKDLL